MTRIQCLWKDSISSSSSSCSSCRNCVANLLTTQIWDLKVNAKFSRFKTLDFKTQLNVFEQFLTCAQDVPPKQNHCWILQASRMTGLQSFESNDFQLPLPDHSLLSLAFDCHSLSIESSIGSSRSIVIHLRLWFTLDSHSASDFRLTLPNAHHLTQFAFRLRSL